MLSRQRQPWSSSWKSAEGHGALECGSSDLDGVPLLHFPAVGSDSLECGVAATGPVAQQMQHTRQLEHTVEAAPAVQHFHPYVAWQPEYVVCAAAVVAAPQFQHHVSWQPENGVGEDAAVVAPQLQHHISWQPEYGVGGDTVIVAHQFQHHVSCQPGYGDGEDTAVVAPQFGHVDDRTLPRQQHSCVTGPAVVASDGNEGKLLLKECEGTKYTLTHSPGHCDVENI